MDKWVEEFYKKNGRKPTFEEFRAHDTEQNSASVGDTPTQQSAQSEQMTSLGQASESPKWAQTAQSTDGAQTSQATQSASASVNTQSKNAGDPQKQPITPENTAMTKQDLTQANQSPALKKPSKSGSKVKHFFRSPIVITAMVAVVLLIAFVTTGLFTRTSRESLRKQYDEAIKNKDSKALLALFPKEQTESRFADIGAKALIKSKKSFEDLEKASAEDDFSLKESRHLLFFKNYSLNASTTRIDKGNAPKDGKLTLDNRKMNKKDFKAPFFPGTYEIKLEVKNQFGELKSTTEVKTGKDKVVSLNFDIEDSYVTLPAGPDTIAVAYGGKETDFKLSGERQMIGPFTQGDQDGESQKQYLSFVGNYGEIQIEGSYLDNMERDSERFLFEGSEMLPIADYRARYEQKELDPYVEAFAEDWFKAGQKGSTKGLTKLKGLTEGTETPKIFRDNDRSKNKYKGVEIEDSEPYTFYIGRDNYLYVVAEFDIVYRSESTDESREPMTLNEPTKIVFRLSKDGKMKAVGDFAQLSYKD